MTWSFCRYSKTVVIASQISIIEIWDKSKYEEEVSIANDVEFAQMVENILGGLEPDNTI